MDKRRWLEWRRKGIGGSDVAAIAGLSKWKSAAEVYLEKIGEIETPEAGEAAYWGTVLEDVVAREFAERTGLKVQRRNAMFQHPEYPFMLANIDRVIVDKEHGWGVLECKTANEYLKGEWDEDNIPDSYYLQVQHYLAVTNLNYAYIAVLIGGNKFRHKFIARDDEMIQNLIKIESEFWQLVESRTPPEVDGSEASTELLLMLYPEAQPDTEILLPPDADILITQYETWKAEEKKVKQMVEEAENKLKALLCDNETGVVGDRKVTWKSITSERFDTKTFKAQHPDMFKQFAKVSSSRRFGIK